MKIIDLQQDTPEWHEFRRSHIGASDAAIVLGLNPWRDRLQLWQEKVEGIQQEMNENMRDGKLREEPAREHYVLTTGIHVEPAVGEHSAHPFISASFDGINIHHPWSVEIKCGKRSFAQASRKQIPDYYMAQMQHQMFVSGHDQMDYYCFNGNRGIVIRVARSQDFIDKMLAEEIKFWQSVCDGIPPGD